MSDGDDGLETLLLRRDRELAFAGGTWVFPGGRVDQADRDAAGDDPSQEAAARHAAVREAGEEAGLSLSPADLVYVSHWTTPEGPARRFATWFFLAEAPRGDVVVDDLEIRAHRWIAPAEAVASKRRGDIDLTPPTFVTLSQLAAHDDVASALEAARGSDPVVYRTRIVVEGDRVCGLYEGDAGYETGDLDAAGPRHRLWLSGEWRYERSDG